MSSDLFYDGLNNNHDNHHDNSSGIGTDNEDEEHGDNPSSAPRRSRFFRSKRKQRLRDEQSITEPNSVDNSAIPTNDVPVNADDSHVEKTNDDEKKSEINDKDSDLSVPGGDVFLDKLTDLDTERQTYLAKKATSHENEVDNVSNTVISTSNKSPFLLNTYDDVEDEHNRSVYTRHQRKKSQSVKLVKVNPNETRERKVVRFADAMGLDLASVKIIATDELPRVPPAAFKHLNKEDKNLNDNSETEMRTVVYLTPLFDNPMHTNMFHSRLYNEKVVLEQANAIDNKIYGTVKLFSFGVNKTVLIRLTVTNWESYSDTSATYIPNSNDGLYDRWTFVLEINRENIKAGNILQFAICYETLGEEHWDSNHGINYKFECISRNIP
ncbi:unnamed protein product [Didymodactylos carnosus]|uniref:CBM21 domain-containing protein n=1 Tax=Didymodactylos carnosus TaxID=1234261 RepID=A0A815IUF3_9BILA|nr:unnamed protein product [Didymodactylos carnosus]CAF1373442.1 unnamed protein product [Didymodactylos carnosus]CAF4059050.1 unnamed protein product [Didymodactylos carnosus]CAF4261910.1 unnamed protein product [Didymodactylos carnosus]